MTNNELQKLKTEALPIVNWAEEYPKHLLNSAKLSKNIIAVVTLMVHYRNESETLTTDLKKLKRQLEWTMNKRADSITETNVVKKNMEIEFYRITKLWHRDKWRFLFIGLIAGLLLMGMLYTKIF